MINCEDTLRVILYLNFLLFKFIVNYLTRYLFKLNKLLFFLIKKMEKLKKNILLLLFSLFIGFFIGNLFGTFVESFRKLHITDSILILILICLNEIINFLVYNPQLLPKTILYNILNAFKVGVLFGFFIDSFKVGS